MVTNGEIKIDIDTDIPVPDKSSGTTKYPFNKMKPGNSILVPPEMQERVASAARAYAMKHNLKFTTRKQPDGSRRIWRTE